MTDIINSIQNITDSKELEDLIKTANQRLDKLKMQQKIRDAEAEIKNKGYYLDINCLNLDNTTTIKIYYKVGLKVWDIDDLGSAKIDDAFHQYGWFGLLGFRFNIDEVTDDIFKEIISNAEEWVSYEPQRSESVVTVYLHYPKIQTLPCVNGTFKVIYDTDVEEWKMVDEKIYDRDNTLVDDINDEENEAFIVPTNLYM